MILQIVIYVSILAKTVSHFQFVLIVKPFLIEQFPLPMILLVTVQMDISMMIQNVQNVILNVLLAQKELKNVLTVLKLLDMGNSVTVKMDSITQEIHYAKLVIITVALAKLIKKIA